MKLINVEGRYINLEAISYALVKSYRSGGSPTVTEEMAEVHFIGGGDPLSITGAGVTELQNQLQALSGEPNAASAAQTVASKVAQRVNVGSLKP